MFLVNQSGMVRVNRWLKRQMPELYT